jgi:hypothetical protein
MVSVVRGAGPRVRTWCPTLIGPRVRTWRPILVGPRGSPSSTAAQYSRQKARRVVESNQIDVVAATVFRDREEIGHIVETRTSRQVWSDVGQADRPNRIHFDLAVIHAVAPTNLDVGTGPYSDTASDGASSHSFSEPLGEDHAASLRLGARLREQWVSPAFLSAQQFME